MDIVKTGSSQTAFKTFCRRVEACVSQSGGMSKWLRAFGRLKTDFERVCHLLRALEKTTRGDCSFAALGLPNKETISKSNAKSDNESIRIRELGNECWKLRQCQASLAYFTAALFYASSDLQKALALGNRSCVLHHLQCFQEAAHDAVLALELGFPKDKAHRLHIRVGQCLLRLNHVEDARQHFERALDQLTSSGPSTSKLLSLARSGLVECQEGSTTSAPPPAWQCVRAPQPVLTADEDENGTPEMCHLVAAASNTVRLRNAGSERGWTLELTRDVSVGDVLLVDRPYASRLNKECFFTHCYHCYTRCQNLRPCTGCSQVGFCSESCAEKACSSPSSPAHGLGRHCYECDSLLPCLLLDNYAGWPKSSSESIGGTDVAHLAFACVADTDSNSLLDFVCRTGRYQAFVGAVARATPPAVFDPGDYASAAWLVANTEHRSPADLWQRTVAAVFLTYCLSIGGYPLTWFEDCGLVCDAPSPQNRRPDRLPASWAAACLLYHLQSVPSNAHSYAETLFPSHDDLRCAEVRALASCLYPSLSLVNHSCDPVVVRNCAANATCSLTALRPLAAGSELLDCYCAHYALQCRAERQAAIASQYCFVCACDACTHNWPGLSAEPLPGTRIFLKCPRCSKRFSLAEAKCTNCGDNAGRKRYTELVEVELPRRLEMSLSGHVTGNSLAWSRTLLEELAELLSRPAPAWDMGQELYKILLTLADGNWCMEPTTP
ncbi:unnamed protein product [Mesocestoides corti]|uniref:SET domain-containing protein n=1 Tax=Mesocestoides corti TaxID=53468 RepID=A0A0R3U7G3_MESCO|nr:unnamed protein product [Mesocestoides corti]